MDGVKRYSLYTSHVAGGTTFIESTEQLRKDFPQAKVYVRAEDFDAALAREAALREQCGGMQISLDEAAEREAALREELAATKVRENLLLNNPNNVFKQMCDLALKQRDAAQQRLTAAEQLSADAIRMLTALYDATPIVWPDVADFLAKNKPTESGASDRAIRDLANDIIDGALSGASE